MENKKAPLRVLLGIMTFIVICIVGFVISQEYTLQTGQEVFLETMPVDPRDPLRGDYVVLRYKIEREETVTNYITNNNLQEGDDIYISINLDSMGFATSSSVSRQQPSHGLFIKGKVSAWRSIDLGIGKYFVPEGTGKEIEKVRSDMQVLIALDKYGTAKIKNLHYKGEKINPDTFIAK